MTTSGAFIIGIVRDGKQVGNAVYNYKTTNGEYRNGVSDLNGVGVGSPDYPGATVRRIFRVNRRSGLVVNVRQDEIEVRGDWKSVQTWSGKPEDLSVSSFKAREDGVLSIGSYNGRFRIELIEIQPAQ